MLKLILTLILLFVAGFFLAREQWNVSLSGFGYEATFSVVFLLFIVLLLTYLMYLAAKPFGWINQYKSHCRQTKACRRETLLTDALRLTLDRDEAGAKNLLKRARLTFPPKSDPLLLIEACFQPTPEIFEELYQNKNTRLAGLVGLSEHFIQENNDIRALNLIEKDPTFLKTIPWLQKRYFDLLICQNEWPKAQQALDKLNQSHLLSKEEYVRLKALILMQRGQLKEAFALMPEHPAIALSYARQKPEDARDILSTSFKKAPCFETYAAYNDLIKSEAPAKRVKLIEKLTARHKGNKVALLALAQTAYEAHLFGMAKEHMDIYLKSWPLTKQAALLMAKIERDGWNHREKALEWEEKSFKAEEKAAWFCAACGHETTAFETSCPMCHKFGALCYRA